MFFCASPWGKGWLKKQSDYLDHQRSVTDRIVDQNRSYEAMIARQYSETKHNHIHSFDSCFSDEST